MTASPAQFTTGDLEKIRQARALLYEVAGTQSCGWCRGHVLDAAAIVHSLENLGTAAGTIERQDPRTAQRLRDVGRRAEELRLLALAGRVASSPVLLRALAIPKPFLLWIAVEMLGALSLAWRGLGLGGAWSGASIALGFAGFCWAALLFLGTRPAWRVLMLLVTVGLVRSALGLLATGDPLASEAVAGPTMVSFVPWRVADYPLAGLVVNVVLLFYVASRPVRYHFKVYRVVARAGRER